MTGPGDAEDLAWDEANEAHLARHGITLDDVEEVLATALVWAPNKKNRSGDWKVVGRGRAGLLLTVIFRYYPDRRMLRPITGWPMTASEKTRYL